MHNMNSLLRNENSSKDIIKIPETISIINTNQPFIITSEDIKLDDSPSTPTFEMPPIMDQNQKSLISIYDNNSPQQQSTINSYPLVGIIGGSQRSEAFLKRLLLSGFPKPVLCDINSTEIDRNDYVRYETFYELSPSIVLITDNLTTNFEDLFPHNNQQLIIDTRQTFFKYFSKKSSISLSSIPNSYRAFGNLSNWEIENGTQRIGVAVEQCSPLNLIKFIHDLNCFSRGIFFLDQYSYNNQQIKSFRNCLFPFISTIIIFTVYLFVSLIEHTNDSYESVFIYRQASSITASTSITLLALLFLIRPTLELIKLIHSIILKQPDVNEDPIPNITLIQYWLESRRYLSWYSLSFGLLHIIFLIFSNIGFDSKLSVYGFFFGILTLILLSILSFVHFPWISERLLWNEYYFLTSYVGPFSLLIAFIHVFLHWKHQSDLFNLKFLSMILPLIVLILRFVIYGIIHPILKLVHP